MIKPRYVGTEEKAAQVMGTVFLRLCVKHTTENAEQKIKQKSVASGEKKTTRSMNLILG